MPRVTRGFAEGLIYHVLNRGNGKQEVFHNDQDHENFIELIRDAKKRYQIYVFAFCLMPNHFHLVVSPLRADDLSKWMQWLMTSHVRRYHKRYETSGHIWQGRFKSFIIQNDEHLLTVLRYVEGNPVRSGLVTSAKDWPWSSHHKRIYKELDKIVDKPPVELPLDWGVYVDQPLSDKELEKINHSVNRQSPFGNDEWQKKISNQFGLEHTLRPQGRPIRKRGQATFQ